MPTLGPRAGGTLLTVEGAQLDTGSRQNLRVRIGGVECAIEAGMISDER